MKQLSYSDAIREALSEEMERDPGVFLMGEDIAVAGNPYFLATRGLLERFGKERVLDAPISESAIVGAAIGAALSGMRPVIELMFSDFSLVAMDQILNQLAKIRYMTGGETEVPVVLRAPTGAYVSGAAQHSQSLEAVFCHVPGLVVIAPATPADAKGLLKSAIRLPDPVVFLEHKVLYSRQDGVPEGEHIESIGRAVVRRSGNDISIISYSYASLMCLQAADALATQGVSAEVIDLRTLNPLDESTIIDSVRKTGRALVVYEAWKRLGYGAEIVAMLMETCFDSLKSPVRRVASENVPMPFGEDLEKRVLPSVEKIKVAAQGMLGRR